MMLLYMVTYSDDLADKAKKEKSNYDKATDDVWFL